jgi:hypothetical protein
MVKTKSRRQKVYKMKGCSTTKKNYLGGSSGDVNLAYPSSNVHSAPNPSLAYTGKNPYSFLHKGGAATQNNLAPNTNVPSNIDGVNKVMPNTGPKTGGLGTHFMNNITPQRGGTCGTCCSPLMKGGCCGSGAPLMNGGSKYSKGGMDPLYSMGFMVGGKRHRLLCKCKSCKMMRKSQYGGNPGTPYPDGAVGEPWTPSVAGWPGVGGVQGDRNYFSLNTYNAGDPQTAMISTGAQPPFSVGGRRRGTRRRNQKGGFNVTNLLAQDFVNLGRQFQYGLGSAYNALAGYPAAANPLPWKGQLPNTPSLSTVKASYI